MPTVGVYLSNSTYMKLMGKHGNKIGKHISGLADKDAAGKMDSLKEDARIMDSLVEPVPMPDIKHSKLTPPKKPNKVINKKTGEITIVESEDAAMEELMGGL